jgi:four helix bundle protein
MAATNSFRDLDVWHEAMALVDDVYALTKRFPAEERFVLTSQLRRATISIPSNIAEGARRKRRKANLYHLDIALGSQAEVEVQVEIGQRLGYCGDTRCRQVQERVARIGRMLNGLIESLQPTDSDWSD